ncbi:hypothetical protein [Falsibacillus albus]|uniref:hypothetical protein n=1 Tax=Falsibacillus albus TaxID=2478915 RepID=UPI0018F5B722|nr:hypothetical protein [Falsibacillus albus]
MVQFYIGDIIYQIIMFGMLILIPIVCIVLFITLKNRRNQLNAIEEKLDRMLAERDE